MKAFQVLSLASVILCSPLLALSSNQPQNADLAQRVDKLEHALRALSDQTQHHAKEQRSSTAQTDEVMSTRFIDILRTRSFSTPSGPYFGSNATYDGAKLLINEPTINKDVGLLRQKQYINKAYGSVAETGARVELSGTFSARIFSKQTSEAFQVRRRTEDIIADAELDMSAQVNDWWLGYSKFAASSKATSLVLNAAFITVGNFDCAPFYMTVGKQFVPSGAFSSGMLSSSLPKLLGRLNARAATVGYAHGGVTSALFGFSSDLKKTENRQLDQWGANLAYKFNPMMLDVDQPVVVKLGASVVNNFAASDQHPAFTDNRLDHYLYGYDARIGVSYRAVGIKGEYYTAIGDFSPNDLTFNQRPASPAASMVEGYYKFPLYGYKSTLYGRYGHTKAALAYRLPKQEYGLALQLDITKHAVMIVEALHRVDYDQSDRALVSNSVSVLGTGEHDNQLSTEVNIYF